jgi:hypothetical protein
MMQSERVMGRVDGDACGCAMGAKFLGAALAASMAWYGWHWKAAAGSPWSACWRIALVSFAAAVVGKMAGLLAYRMRQARASTRSG